MAGGRIVKLISTGLSFLAVLVLGANIDAFLDSTGANKLLTKVLGDDAQGLTDIVSSPWFQFPGVAVIAFTVGLWVDSWLTKRPAKLHWTEELARESIQIARRCRAMADSYIAEDATPIIARIASIMIRYEKLGFSTPDLGEGNKVSVNVMLRLAAHYLFNVGQLLADGHQKEAKELASHITTSEALSQLLPSLQDTGGRI